MSWPPAIADVTELQGTYLVTFEGHRDGLLISQALVTLHNNAYLVPPKLAVQAFAEGTHREVWLRYCRVLRHRRVQRVAPLVRIEPSQAQRMRAAALRMQIRHDAELMSQALDIQERRVRALQRRPHFGDRHHGIHDSEGVPGTDEYPCHVDVDTPHHPYVSYISQACWEGLGS